MRCCSLYAHDHRSRPKQKIYFHPQSAIQVIGVLVRCAPKSPTGHYVPLTCQRSVGSSLLLFNGIVEGKFIVSEQTREVALPFRKTTNQLSQIYCFSTLGAIPKIKFLRLPGARPYENEAELHFLPLHTASCL